MNSKPVIGSFLLIALLMLSFHTSQAQYRPGPGSTLDRTGQITQPRSDEQLNWRWGLQDFQMNHSYEMNLSSFGGNMYNQNIYTNTMHLLFNENLYGRIDLSMAHSPLGQGFMGQENHTQFFIRNAELNYIINDNARIRLQFQQLPPGPGFGYYSPHHYRNRYTDYPGFW